MVPTPQRLVSSSQLEVLRMTVARAQGSPRRACISRKLPRRESRMFPLDLYARVHLYHSTGTRDRGCSVHPAFPAPSNRRGRDVTGKPRAYRAARSRRHISFDAYRLFETRIKAPSTSLRAKRSNPTFLCCGMDCFVASAPRNDVDGLVP